MKYLSTIVNMQRQPHYYAFTPHSVTHNIQHYILHARLTIRVLAKDLFAKQCLTTLVHKTQL